MRRPHPFYRNPFHAARVVVGRIDMGIDYHGYGPISAIGKAKIICIGGNGWPGGCYILYRLLRGRHKGRYVYVAEAVTPLVKPGQVVKKGQSICDFGADAAPGTYPGIETGWGSPICNLTLAAYQGDTGGVDHADSPAGLAFARFLKRIGAPHPPVGPGREYPV